MILMSLLLAAVTFNPAIAPRQAMGPSEGFIQAQAISPDSTCKPGNICASVTLTGKHNGCFFNNFFNGNVGGTPLTMDVTETGGNGSKVFVYWVNATNKNITIVGGTAKAHFYCVPL